MAKRKSSGSIAGLLNQKKRLKAQIAAKKKKVKDAQRANKLRREVASLQKQARGGKQRK
jgi:hypothetical protein